MPDAHARLDALEMRVAYQDEAIEQLNATVTAQWATIDALNRRIAMMAERLEDAQAAPSSAPEPPPPHY